MSFEPEARTQQQPQNESATKKAPLKVGVAVGLASAGVLSVLSAVLLFTVWSLSRSASGPGGRSPHGPGRHGDGRWQERVVDLGQIVPLMVILSILSVLFVSLIAWWATKRANQPIEQALAVQRAFVADASHELRTPLTTLTSRIQLAQRRLERGGDVSESLVEMRQDATVMNNVLNDLLVAAESFEKVDPNAHAIVADTIISAFRVAQPLADEKRIRLDYQSSQDLAVQADETALARALVALIDNAIRHSPLDSTVFVSASRERYRGKDLVAIRVSDQGRGIQVTDPERLFERFARVDSSSERRGFGLGLALVRDIATRFGGTVSVESTSSNGTTFLLVLPAWHG